VENTAGHSTHPHIEDPALLGYRERIETIDREILDAVTRRLELVAQIREHKARRGIPFHDPEREALLIERLRQANSGALSDGAVEELFTTILALLKREAERMGRA
jgi:chorismate mutase